MLEMTLSTRFEPGTNLSGNLARADWRYLLPSLELSRLLCIGIPAPETLAVLGTIAREMQVAEPDAQRLKMIATAAQELGVENLSNISVDHFSTLDLPEQSLDLIYVTRRMTAALLADPKLIAKFQRSLKPDAHLYLEISGQSQKRRFRQIFAKNTGFQETARFWLTPFSGELRTAVPVNDRDASEYFFKNVLFGQSFKKRSLSQIGALLSQTGWIDTVMPRHAMLLSPKNSKTELPFSPPAFLQEIAQKAGFSLSKYRFALSARGKYNSNKVIFFLFNRETDQVEMVIKMTRSPEYNARLENEFRMLKHLKDNNLAEAGTYPEPFFFDYHNNLAVIAIRAVYGAPFRVKTTAKPDCPVAADAANWLATLGKRSANMDAASAGDAATALQHLFEQFQQTYSLPDDEAGFLANAIAEIAESTAPFPTVFQHGDPGTWNMLVNDANRVIVIDWESGEPQGMPMWDLLYFYRTFASWVARQSGENDPQKNFAAHFLLDSPINRLMAAQFHHFAAEIQLDPALIRPLFYTCWMHRALKESMRLSPEQMAGGTFVNILRMCIREKNAPGLRAIFEQQL